MPALVPKNGPQPPSLSARCRDAFRRERAGSELTNAAGQAEAKAALPATASESSSRPSHRFTVPGSITATSPPRPRRLLCVLQRLQMTDSEAAALAGEEELNGGGDVQAPSI